MITSGFTYLATLTFLSGCLMFVASRSRSRILDYVPAIVLLYFGVMLLASAGLWERNADTDAAYLRVRDDLVPAMIFLMLLKSDLRLIRRLGARMLLGFFAATVTIVVGFTVSFALFHEFLADDSWMTYAALSGSWIGGTANMAAIQAALEVPDSSMGYALLMDSIDYAIWVAILLALVPFAKIFNRWTKADATEMQDAASRLDAPAADAGRPAGAADLMFLSGIALLASAAVQALAVLLPTSDILTTNAWTVLVITLAGVAAALDAAGPDAGLAGTRHAAPVPRHCADRVPGEFRLPIAGSGLHCLGAGHPARSRHAARALSRNSSGSTCLPVALHRWLILAASPPHRSSPLPIRNP